MEWFAKFVNNTFANDKDEELNQWEYAEGIPESYLEESVSMKDTFLKYVEATNSAYASQSMLGSSNKRTVKAFEEANTYKRSLLNMIEDIEDNGDQTIDFNSPPIVIDKICLNKLSTRNLKILPFEFSSFVISFRTKKRSLPS